MPLFAAMPLPRDRYFRFCLMPLIFFAADIDILMLLSLMSLAEYADFHYFHIS